MTFEATAIELARLARNLSRRGWLLGTSGNLSAVVARDPLRLAVTPSGVDKGALRAEQLLLVGETGDVLGGEGKPSAELPLHLELVRSHGAGAVLHTHSIWATVLSCLHSKDGGVAIQELEMLKALRGVTSHEHRAWLPIVANSTDAREIAREMRSALGGRERHGFLIRGHGLYTWGHDLPEAKRQVEALEFLLEVAGRLSPTASETLAMVRLAGRQGG
jgi:methylthioribulose-1-phosphate dehydratase